jgi:hypothetical protein
VITNSEPAAEDDTAITDEDTPILIPALANDTDPDGDTLTIDSVTQPANGSVVNNGSDVTYTPNSDFNGTDNFSYTVIDGNSAVPPISRHSDPVNDDPVANDDTAITDEDLVVVIPVLVKDTDVDGDTLTIDSVTQPTNVNVVNNGSDVTYTLIRFNRVEAFSYTVSDGNGGWIPPISPSQSIGQRQPGGGR